MIYLLDANVISDLLARVPQVRSHVLNVVFNGDKLAICRPIYYELLRGLFWSDATGKLTFLNRRVLPYFSWTPLTNADWEQAAHFWSDARRQGRQLSDPDLLLAALAYRLGATVVSNDTDYDNLPVTRVDWRV